MQAMDLIDEGFRPKYEQICIGNKTKEARHVFFEGLLLEEGLGMHMTRSVPEVDVVLIHLQDSARVGMANHLGDTLTTRAVLFVLSCLSNSAYTCSVDAS